jgi:hypothetical protein
MIEVDEFHYWQFGALQPEVFSAGMTFMCQKN